MTEDAVPLSERETLAAEWVLGLLDGERLLRARGLLARDPAFANEVARWEDRFAPLMAEWDEREPPREVWQRIAAQTVAEGSAVGADVVALRRSRDRWRWVGGLAAATAALLAVVVMTSGPVTESALPETTAVDDRLLAANIPIGDTSLRLALTYVPGRDALTVSSAGLTADGVHDHELWLVDREGDLHSLGVIDPGGEARLAVAPELADEFDNGTRLVLTREPLGGKPADAEAGPVVAEGTFQAI